MAKASDNEFPSVLFTDGTADPSTPSANTARIYVKDSSGAGLYLIDDAGTVTGPFIDASASSSPLTTKGDLFVYGTGDARLPVGSNDQVLTADSSQALGVKWAAASGGGGASPVAPDAISGLQVWLRASDLSYVDDDPVSQWDDESGNANHFTQGTAGKRPTFKTSQINGLAVVRFDNSDDGLDSSVSITAAPYTIGYVAKYNSPSASAERRVMNGSNNWLMGPYSKTWQFYSGRFSGAGNTSLYEQGSESATSGQWVFHLLQRTTNSTFHTVRSIDGPAWEYIGFGTGTIHPGTLLMAASGSAGFSQVADSDVAEVFYWNTAVGQSDIEGLWEYIKDRYRP